MKIIFFPSQYSGPHPVIYNKKKNVKYDRDTNLAQPHWCTENMHPTYLGKVLKKKKKFLFQKPKYASGHTLTAFSEMPTGTKKDPKLTDACSGVASLSASPPKPLSSYADYSEQYIWGH